mgnify:CR=1 FL=1
MMEALSPANIGLLLFGIFFVLLLIGSPIMVALGVATMACFIVLDIDLSLMIERAFASLTAFPLMALPAFVLAGSLMEAAGVSRRLVHVAENIVGPTPGGLAISTTLSCVFFGAISGSGPATTAAVGMLMIPAMAKRGYNVGYAAAATATAGGIGIIIPPSIPMVAAPIDFVVELVVVLVPEPQNGRAGLVHEDLHPLPARRLLVHPRPGDHPWRHLRRYLHADGSRRRGHFLHHPRGYLHP